MLFASLSLAFSNCSISKKKREVLTAAAEAKVEAEAEGLNIQQKQLTLKTVEPKKIRFKSAHALNTMYRRVFKKTSIGYAHCNYRDAMFVKDYCNSSIFSIRELEAIGGYGIHTYAVLGPINNIEIKDAKLGYMRSLRNGLGRECKNLIESEMGSSDESEAFFVNDSNPPNGKMFREYIALILGLEGHEDLIPVQFDPLEESLIKIWKTEETESISSKRKQALINACISVSMHPIVITI
jgi:hypothetical protein